MILNSNELDNWHANVPKSSRNATHGGLALLAICVFGFGLWGGIAPIEGAIVTSGRFVANGQNKQLQHLEGGIVEAILVSEGQVVSVDQPLVRLDDTQVAARVRRLELRSNRLAISRARLEAQIDGRATLELPERLKPGQIDKQTAEMIDRQRVELNADNSRLTAEEDVLKKEISSLEKSIAGFEDQANSTQQRLVYFEEEIEAKQSLFERALVRRSDLLQLKRAESNLHGEMAQIRGRIADSRERVARAQKQIVSLRTVSRQKAIEELRRVETDLDDVDEQLNSARKALKRTVLTAPVKGVIVRINRHTNGAVVAPGEVILEILPLDAELVIEARVAPAEITQVQVGQAANVRLSALNRRSTPIVGGKVSYVSADAIGERPDLNGSSAGHSRDSFVVRVHLDGDYRMQIGEGFEPSPGMPADLYIKTKARTFFGYLMRPVFDSFSRAFRED